MQVFNDVEWVRGCENTQLEIARHSDEEQLRALARGYDWEDFSERVLGWIMAQKCIDLETALTVFMNGAPERFNYIPKRDVPQEFSGLARVLDTICLRVNSGFYLAYPDSEVAIRKWVSKWLSYQQADRAEARRGRWILDEDIVTTLMENVLRMDRTQEAIKYPKPSILRDLFSPVLALGLDRQILKYKPPRP